jgi:hypothetical protein
MSEDFRGRVRNIVETAKVKEELAKDATRDFIKDWGRVSQEIFSVLKETEEEALPEEGSVKAVRGQAGGDVALIANIRKRSYELRFHPEVRKLEIAVKSSTPRGRDENNNSVEWLTRETVETLVEEFLAAVFNV